MAHFRSQFSFHHIPTAEPIVGCDWTPMIVVDHFIHKEGGGGGGGGEDWANTIKNYLQ